MMWPHEVAQAQTEDEISRAYQGHQAASEAALAADQTCQDSKSFVAESLFHCLTGCQESELERMAAHRE